jgi:hypothetical protein
MFVYHSKKVARRISPAGILGMLEKCVGAKGLLQAPGRHLLGRRGISDNQPHAEEFMGHALEYLVVDIATRLFQTFGQIFAFRTQWVDFSQHDGSPGQAIEIGRSQVDARIARLVL